MTPIEFCVSLDIPTWALITVAAVVYLAIGIVVGRVVYSMSVKESPRLTEESALLGVIVTLLWPILVAGCALMVLLWCVTSPIRFLIRYGQEKQS